MRRDARNRSSLPSDVPTVEAMHSADAVEQRRLARAVRADDADDLALPHLERHTVHGGHAPEALRHPTQLELSSRGVHSEVSRNERRKYAQLKRVRPPKKSITPRGMKITTTISSRPRMICATIGCAWSETKGIWIEIGRLPPRNWISSCSKMAPTAGPNTVPVPPSSAIRIIWTLYSIGNALSWLIKTFHCEKIPPASPVSAAASAKAATL